MLDWWQAALLSVISAVAGGSIGLVTAYYTQRWTNSSAREAEERQAKRQTEEEERQATRQLRRERAKPILDFLKIAKRYAASEDSVRAMSNLHAENVAGMRDIMRLEDLQQMMRERYPAPTMIELLQAFSVAFGTTSTTEVRRALTEVLRALQMPATMSKASPAIRAAEEAAERYMVEV